MPLCRCSALYQSTKPVTQARACSRVSKGLCGYLVWYLDRAPNSRDHWRNGRRPPGRVEHGAMTLEMAERGEHRRPAHGPAVVGVQDQTVRVDALRGTRRAHERGRRIHRLLLVDLETDDAAAPDIHHEVEVEEAPPDRAEEIRDVPAPHLVGGSGNVLFDLTHRARLAPAPVGVLPFGSEDPVDRRFRRHVAPFVGEAWNDLFRRQIAAAGRVDDLVGNIRALRRGREHLRDVFRPRARRLPTSARR